MSKVRRVKQGEHLSGIAAQEGFANFRTIFDHPNNEPLRLRERDPHVLFPGDEVFVPDRADRVEPRATDAAHPFETEIRPLFLRCKLLDWHRTSIKAAPCQVTIDGKAVPPLTSDGGGIVEQRIGRLAKAALIEVELPPPKVVGEGEEALPRQVDFHVKIGSLNPASKLSGQQARLNNLGYMAGFDVRDLDQLLWAAEEFQCDDTGGQKVAKKPQLVPAPPQGEDDPEKNDLDGKTGIQDEPLLQRLKTSHGF